MKTLDIPKSGKCGNIVTYRSRYGNCQRALVVPANTPSPARQQRRGAFGGFARAWGRVLTQAQREVWNVAGPTVQSKTRLGSGPLTGQQLFQGLNSARSCIGRRDLLLLPTAQVVFGPSPVGQLIARNGEDGVRLLLSVTGPVAEDIMVFGQAPCSAGRSKRRNVAYLGLLPASQDGMSDITDIYIARYGEPRAGEKVFIVTRQQKDGWEGDDLETNEIVPERPGSPLACCPGTAWEPLPCASLVHPLCIWGINVNAPVATACCPAGVPNGQAGAAEVAGGGRDSQWPMADSQVLPKAGLGGGRGVSADAGTQVGLGASCPAHGAYHSMMR